MVDPADFGSWSWQVKNRIDDADTLARLYDLSPREREGFDIAAPLFRFGVTP